MNRNRESIPPDKNIFDMIIMKCLLRGHNVCAPDWGETDCLYGYNKFYYFQSGDGTIIIQGTAYHPRPGELYLIPAGTKHTYFHDPLHPVFKYWCHFDLVFSGKQKIIYTPETIMCTPDPAQVIPLFDKLVRLDASESALDLLSEKSILLELFRIFLEHVSYQKMIPQDGDHFISKINDFIMQNLQSQITLQQMAAIVPLHPNYFIPYFRQYFSMPPMEYVNAMRLEKAAQLLIETPEMRIEQAAYSVGFNDYRYFTRSFKKRYGLSPSEYRGLKK